MSLTVHLAETRIIVDAVCLVTLRAQKRIHGHGWVGGGHSVIATATLRAALGRVSVGSFDQLVTDQLHEKIFLKLAKNLSEKCFSGVRGHIGQQTDNIHTNSPS